MLKNSLNHFKCYKNVDNFYLIYDILLLCFKNCLNDSMHSIHKTFYPIFNKNYLNNLYSKLIHQY